MLRACSALLLALFLNASVGAPIADAVWFHAADATHLGAHVEAAGSSCHAERCSLDAPAAPTALHLSQMVAPVAAFSSEWTQRWTAREAPLDRTPSHAPGSRAPPA